MTLDQLWNLLLIENTDLRGVRGLIANKIEQTTREAVVEAKTKISKQIEEKKNDAKQIAAAIKNEQFLDNDTQKEMIRLIPFRTSQYLEKQLGTTKASLQKWFTRRTFSISYTRMAKLRDLLSPNMTLDKFYIGMDLPRWLFDVENEYYVLSQWLPEAQRERMFKKAQALCKVQHPETVDLRDPDIVALEMKSRRDMIESGRDE